MKRNLYLLLNVLFFGSIFFATIPDVQAQFTKVDATKTPSKLSIWFQTQKASCEKTLEGIQTSQFGQFVGDGIKYTKEGISYADDLQTKNSELYGEVTESTLNSQECKTAMISKEIAEESQKLKELQEEKLKKQESIQAEMDLLKEQTSAKINNVRQNIANLEQSMEDTASTDGEEGVILTKAEGDLSKLEDKELEKSPEMETIEEEIEQIQNELDMQLEDYESEFENIENEYEEKILEQSEKIAELTQELSEASGSSTLIKKETKDTSEALQETQNKFLFYKAPSIKEENKIKKQRKEALSDVIVETTTIKADKQLSRAIMQEKTDTKEDLGDTMPGESEGSGISAEVLTEQLKILRSYIDVVLADLKLQASIEVNSLRRINSVPLKDKFNLCNYTDSSNVGAEGLKKKADKAMSSVNKLQESASQVKENVSKAQEKASEVKAGINNATDQYQQVKDMAKEAQGVGKNYNIDVDPSTIGVF